MSTFASWQINITCGSHQDFIDRRLLLKVKLLNQCFLLVKLKSSLRKFYGRCHDLVNRYGISVSQMTTDMFHLSEASPGPFLIHDFTGFVTRVTRRMSLGQQELPTFPEHLSSLPVLSEVRVARSFGCLCSVLQFVVCPLYFFLLTIMLYILPFTDSDYSFGIFQLFLLSSR